MIGSGVGPGGIHREDQLRLLSKSFVNSSSKIKQKMLVGSRRKDIQEAMLRAALELKNGEKV